MKQNLIFNPREGQKEISGYTSGRLGITAVPGSGKTHTLSYLAAKLIAESNINEDQEILIVTLVNSAVNNFAAKIAEFLKRFNLIPGVGYRVRTLHGLAYDIVREQPHLAGMDNMFSIADERTSSDILSMMVINWMRTHPETVLALSAGNVDPGKQKRNWNGLLLSIAGNGIALCKDLLIDPRDLLSQTAYMSDPLFAMLQKVYSDYERALFERGAVDFSDLIRVAYKMLTDNPGYLNILQDRWPYILEDEAQDSSLIQEKLLSILSSKHTNWVRVGDPNQAIFETFTTADPQLLRNFTDRDDVNSIDLPRSGRSTKSIISLANFLIEWTRGRHPKKELRHALDLPLIKRTASDDPQPNPPDDPNQIVLYDHELSPDEEIQVVAASVGKWITENPDRTTAILIPRNARGAEMVEELSRKGIPYLELLSISKTTRQTASILADILSFFAKPLVRRNLTRSFLAVASQIIDMEISGDVINHISGKLNKMTNPEFLFTEPNGLLDVVDSWDLPATERQILQDVFSKLQFWQSTVLMPIEEMIVTIASDLFKNPVDLALSHRIALILQKAKDYYPEWGMEDFADELQAIARNKYRLYGFTEESMGFDPDKHKGRVVVSTMHKAKGLEWDRVYLLSVNNYNFPSLDESDRYIAEKWFVKDQRNLEAEVLTRIHAIEKITSAEEVGPVINAKQDARVDFCAERLRLLYVGMTRARQELIITWNNGKNGDCVEALPLIAMREYWNKDHAK